MKRYEVLPHGADLKIRAFGKTKEEFFQRFNFKSFILPIEVIQ